MDDSYEAPKGHRHGASAKSRDLRRRHGAAHTLCSLSGWRDLVAEGVEPVIEILRLRFNQFDQRRSDVKPGVVAGVSGHQLFESCRRIGFMPNFGIFYSF